LHLAARIVLDFKKRVMRAIHLNKKEIARFISELGCQVIRGICIALCKGTDHVCVCIPCYLGTQALEGSLPTADAYAVQIDGGLHEIL